jgi:hypothetical protein
VHRIIKNQIGQYSVAPLFQFLSLIVLTLKQLSFYDGGSLVSLFLYRMKAPMTREKYRGRLAKFFDFIGLIGVTIEERSKTFTERGKKEPDWVFVSVLRFAQAQKERVRNGEKSPTTLKNYIKAVKLY